MSQRKAKRVWDKVSVRCDDTGYGINLDAKALMTPAKSAFVVPTDALAYAIAAEWDAQQEFVDPDLMPFTRTANSAIDKVAPQFDEIVEMLAAYGDCDLLCYRAESPWELVQRQNAAWDPVLDWAAQALQAPLVTRVGILHQPQPTASLNALKAKVGQFSHFELSGVHDLVALSGSLVLAFATVLNWDDADAIWALSRVDERWQSEQWGDDEQAEALETVKRKSFIDAKLFVQLAQKKG